MSLPFKGDIIAIDRAPDKDLFIFGGSSWTKIYSLNDKGEFDYYVKLNLSKSKNNQGTNNASWNKNMKYKNTLATSNYENTIIKWDITNVRMSQKIGIHTSLVNGLDWNLKNPCLLASCSRDSTFCIWDINTKEKPAFKADSKDFIKKCKFCPNNENYILSSDEKGIIKLWDLRNFNKKSTIDFLYHLDTVYSIDWHPTQENIFVSGGIDNNIFIWDINKKSPIISYPAKKGLLHVKWLNYNPQYFLSSSYSDVKFIQMWNINIENVPEYKYKGCEDISGIVFDKENQRIITSSRKGKVEINKIEDNIRIFGDMRKLIVNYSNYNELVNYQQEPPKKESLTQCNLSRLNSYQSDDKETFDLPYSVTNFHKNDFELINKNKQANKPMNLYYLYSKEQIKNYLNNYQFLLKENTFSKVYFELLDDAIQNNYNYALKVQNRVHILIWEEFKINPELISLEQTVKYESQFDINYIFLELFRKRIFDTISMIIHEFNDLILAIIISNLFCPFLFTDPKIKKSLLKMENNIIDNLFRVGLLYQAARLKKFGFGAGNKIVNYFKQFTFNFSCKTCEHLYSGKSCPCKKKMKCATCQKEIGDFFYWCSGCGHGGHPKEIKNWFSNKGECPNSYCKHKCKTEIKLNKI